MIDMQEVLNDLYYKHGFQHNTVYDHDRFYSVIYTDNATLSITIVHTSLRGCNQVLLRVTDKFTSLSLNRKYKTSKGLIKRIKSLENKIL